MKNKYTKHLFDRSLKYACFLLFLLCFSVFGAEPNVAQRPKFTSFLIDNLLVLIVTIIFTLIIIRFFFKKSILGKFIFFWAVNIILVSINTSAGSTYREYYPNFLSLLAGVIGSVTLVTLATRAVKDPLTESIRNATLLAKGKLDIVNTQTPKVVRTDLDELNEALVTMAQNQSRILLKINSLVEHLFLSGESLKELSTNLHSGSSNLSSSIEQISAAIEQMSAAIEQIAYNSEQTKNISEQANTSIEQVSESLESNIQLIAQASEKVSVINEIAQQTNLLSLNASIEAARAGSSGSGFAVVAGEVGKLAETSGLAAKAIVELSEKNVSSVKESGALLGQTIPKIKKTYSLVEDITNSSAEQKNTTSQIHKTLESLNTVSQNNIQFAEKLLDEQNRLRENAYELKNAISYFGKETTT